MISSLEYTQRVKSNQKQQSKVSWKRSEARKMAEAIHTFLLDQGIELPKTKYEYQSSRESMFTTCQKVYDVLDNKNKVVGKRVLYCVDDSIANYFEEIINFYYKIISCNKGVYALFTNQGVTIPMLMMAWYTKHRLDPLWLMRKSQLIRRLYLQYFEVATVEADNGKNVKLTDHLQPYHLTLTVPHKDGIFKDQEFYAKELNTCFLKLRRSNKWKDSVHGGEYGIEVKPSHTGNGLHIHIHSLLFLKENAIEHVFESWIKKRWKKLTSGATQLHFEKLYVWKKEFEPGCIGIPIIETINGKKMQKVQTSVDENGDIESVGLFRYKKYITPGCDVNDYMKGVMECIKYHFKTDAITDENGNYDVPLMANILNNSKGLRFYSKFGSFYNEPLLNFDNLKVSEPEENEVLQLVENEFEEEEKITGKAKTAVDSLINPFTFEPANEGTYEIGIAIPEMLKYTGKNGVPPYSLCNYDDSHFIVVADKNASLTDIVQLMVHNKLHTVTGLTRFKRKNRKHLGYYEHDWFCGEANLIFEAA